MNSINMKRVSPSQSTCAALLAGMVLFWLPASARAFVAPSQWTRGQADTTYQEWDVFTSATGPNAPDVGVSNPNGTPDLTNNAGGILTGGNIYSFAGPLDVDLLVPDYNSSGDVTTVILQTLTLGTEMAPASLNIGGIAPIDQAELSRTALGGPGGYAVESWFKFHLPYSASSFTIAFQAAGPHMSLDRVAVDSITSGEYVPEPNPVPEPVTAALLLTGSAVLLPRRKREQGN